MKYQYDPEVDALYIRLTDEKIIESEEVQPGIIFDFDANGKLAAVEVLGSGKPKGPTSPIAKAA
jgi:uncharacterized protein YuzE